MSAGWEEKLESDGSRVLGIRMTESIYFSESHHPGGLLAWDVRSLDGVKLIVSIGPAL